MENRTGIDAGLLSVSRPVSPVGTRTDRRPSSDSRINIHALPPQAETRALLKFYFDDTGRLFPYLHEQTFMDIYDQVCRGEYTKIRKTWLGLLNMVLALVTNTLLAHADLIAEERAAKSEIHYRRALGLCEKAVMRGTSLEIGTFSDFFLSPP